MMLPAYSNGTQSSLILPNQTCQRLTLAEIQSATQNFDEKLVIGHGGFGKVYKCPMTIGSVVTDVAIKRLDSKSDQGPTEFEAEVKLLSKLRHGNLVSLIGYCSQEKEMVLVYEFMPNGNLKDHLHKVDCGLSWLQRLHICVGAARALEYLHTGTATQQGVTHRDVKTSNILLDANFAAKVSDFGLAKIGPINQTRTDVSTGVKGTFGYMDPCYFFSGKLTRKSDVYAFGVVLFEVLSGKQAVDSTLDEDQWSLAAWVQDQIKEGKLKKIIDSKLIGHISKKCLKEFAGIASQCLHTQPKQRPTMAEVVVKLESILSHEKFANPVVDERRFINKVRSLLTGKANLMTPASAVGSFHKSENGSLRIFTYAELVSATNNFKVKERSPTLHEFVYKGWIDEKTYTPTESGVGLAIYVTKKHVFMSKLNNKPEEFNHPNFSKLLGYCWESRKLFCVYTLISEASLDKLLYGEQSGTSLSWAARLKIVLGAAHDLHMLRKRKYPAYRLFNTACILVDTDFNVRLTDFEVERPPYDFGSSFFEEGPSFYAAPEWRRCRADLHGKTVIPFSDNDIDVKSEIYSFGVVLLEILAGMKVYDKNRPPGKKILVYWATPFQGDKEELRMIVDPRLQHNTGPPKGAFQLAMLASKCLELTKAERPSMEEILHVLNECYQEEVKSI